MTVPTADVVAVQYDLRVFPGDHFYLDGQAAAVTAVLRTITGAA